ncbi:MAG: hypothetical protein ACLQGP_36765 [Isosphaeraceae bacterium]
MRDVTIRLCVGDPAADVSCGVCREPGIHRSGPELVLARTTNAVVCEDCAKDLDPEVATALTVLRANKSLMEALSREGLNRAAAAGQSAWNRLKAKVSAFLRDSCGVGASQAEEITGDILPC